MGMVGEKRQFPASRPLGKVPGNHLKPHATNEALKRLMTSYGLSIKDVTERLEVTIDTVKSWRVSRESSRYRKMPGMALKLLKMQLKYEPPR